MLKQIYESALSNSKFQTFIFLILLTFCPMILFGGKKSGAWEHCYQEALLKARSENKHLLLFFNGSDWSGLGMKMKNEVLDSEEFANVVHPFLICMEIDFPLHKTLPDKLNQQNFDLKTRHQIDTYPFLVILDNSEREVIRLGYLPEEGKRLGKDLIRIIEQDSQLHKADFQECNTLTLRQLYRYAEELGQKTTRDQILSAGIAKGEAFFILEKYRHLVEEGLRSSPEAISLRQQLVLKDPHNTQGVHFSIALIDFQALSKEKGMLKEAHEVIKPLVEYIEKYGEQDPTNLWRIEMMIAQFYLEGDEWKQAQMHTEIALNAAPQDVREEIEHTLIYIKTQNRQE